MNKQGVTKGRLASDDSTGTSLKISSFETGGFGEELSEELGAGELEFDIGSVISSLDDELMSSEYGRSSMPERNIVSF